MKNLRWLLCGLISLSTFAEDLVTGPPVGTDLGAVRCYANSGPYAGQESFDAAEEIGSRPGALLFVHTLNRNTAPVIRGVGNLAREFGLFGFKAFIVTLSNDRTAAEEQLRRVNGSLRLNDPMVLSLDGLDGPGSLALNRRCTLSLIGIREGKVVESIGFTDTGLHDIDRIRALAEKTIGDVPSRPAELIALAEKNLPNDPEALRTLAARQAVDLYRLHKKATEDFANSRRYERQQPGMMRQGRENARGNQRMNRRPGGRDAGKKPENVVGNRDTSAAPVVAKRERRGGPPKDEALSTLLRSFIRKTNDAARVDSIHADIVERTKQSEDLLKEGIAMFQLMLSFPDRYGSEHAQSLARAFLKAHNAE